jgi:FkbM family methyltransferase
MAMHYRNNSDSCRIQSIEKIIDFSGDEYYWYDRNPRLAYDALTFCDGGAFIGDTLLKWYETYSKTIRSYYGFEPDPFNYLKLKDTIDKIKINGKVYQAGLGDRNNSIPFSKTGNAVSSFILPYNGNNETCFADIKRLDDLDIRVDGKLCIKMDIEGFELKALQGAAETIKIHRPELAICVYHTANDIFEIPQYIKSINTDYKCILRGGVHMICYAHCEEK